MARINYTKEWLRIVTNLERTEARFVLELELAGTDEERHDAEVKLRAVRKQLAHARGELERMTLVKPRYPRHEG